MNQSPVAALSQSSRPVIQVVDTCDHPMPDQRKGTLLVNQTLPIALFQISTFQTAVKVTHRLLVACFRVHEVVPADDNGLPDLSYLCLKGRLPDRPL